MSVSTNPPSQLPLPPRDSEAMYRAVIHPPSSAVPGLVKFGMVCAVVGVFIWHAAKVATAQGCTANGGTWDGSKCMPPVYEVKQYHIILQAEPDAPPPAKPQALPQGPAL